MIGLFLDRGFADPPEGPVGTVEADHGVVRSVDVAVGLREGPAFQVAG
jgi:hypothetical protein